MEFSSTTLTVGALLAIAGAVWGVVRAVDWLNAKIESAISPISIKISALELRMERLQEKQTEHEMHVLKHFVTGAAVVKLEGRMDEGFRSMHDEMTSLRNMLIKQLAHDRGES